MKQRPESHAQIHARELKEMAWREVEHLPVEEALRARMQSASASARGLNLPIPVRDPRIASGAAGAAPASAVREDAPDYNPRAKS